MRLFYEMTNNLHNEIILKYVSITIISIEHCNEGVFRQ